MPILLPILLLGLEHLNIAQNKLTGSLAPLSQLTRLRKIKAHNTTLSGTLDTFVALTKLEVLNLGCSPVTLVRRQNDNKSNRY